MSDLLISGPKVLNSRKVHLLGDSGNASYPYDAEAGFVYYSKAGGFIKPEMFIDSPLSNPAHYGAGGFEGVRVYYTPFGTVFPELENNIIRIMFSTIAFDDIIQKAIIDEYHKEDVVEIRQKRITPRELFEMAGKCQFQNKEPELPPLTIVKKDGSTFQKSVALRMRAMIGNEITDIGFKDMDTIMKVLAYANKLVSIDYFPQKLEMALSGYFRPFFWVSGEEGLKVPTEGKPFYFAVATLPWALYLREEDYVKGLDVIYSPYPRIDKDMPTDKKVAGNYVNSALAINLAKRLTHGETIYGEILACKNGNVVEGSAENIYVILEKGDGKYRVFVPPISDGPLPGTTRDRVMRVLEQMERNGTMEIIYQSPTKDVVEGACAVLFSGTGAQLIHARSITEDKNLVEMANASKLASEESGAQTEVLIRKTENSKRVVLINEGKKHPIIDEIQRRYESLVLTPSVLRPVYDINIDSFAKTLGMDAREFAPQCIINDYRAGMMKDYTNFVGKLQELTARTGNVIQAGFEKKGLLRRVA